MSSIEILATSSPATPRDGAEARTRGGRLDLVLALTVCLLAQVAGGALVARTHGFWSPDSALRFIQVERLLASGYRDLSVPYPGASLDPDGRYFPLGRWFHFRHHGRYYLSYLPYFSMVSAPPYRLWGFAGLLLVPAAAVVGAVWVTFRVVWTRSPRLACAAAVALALATPLGVYGIVFWDHTLAVLCAAAALALLLTAMEPRGTSAWRIGAAGTLLGLGFWVRNEMYLFAGAVAIAWWFASPRAALRGAAVLFAGMAPPIALLWAVNTWLSGSPFGWKGHDLMTTRVAAAAHAAAAGPSGAAALVFDKLGNAYYQLASPDFYAYNAPAIAEGLVLSTGLLVAAFLVTVSVSRRSASCALGGALLASAITVLVLSGRTMVSGLLPAAPIVILAAAADTRGRWERFLWTVIVLFGAAVIITGTHGGLQWGPRYLLPLLPPLVWLAAAGVDRIRRTVAGRWPAVRVSVAVLAASALMLQLAGFDQILQASARNARLDTALRQAPADIIVTPLEWLMVGAGRVYFEKALLLVQTPEDFRRLVGTLAVQRVPRWTYIPFAGSAFDPMAVARWTAGGAWHFRPSGDGFSEGLRAVTYEGSGSASLISSP